MNNNILLTLNYEKDTHLCVSTTHSLINQTTPLDIVSIFSNSENKDIYESYFKQYDNNLVKFICNQNNSLSVYNLYHQYLPKYEWFVFLSPHILYNKNFTEELKTLCSKNNDKNILCLFSHNDNNKTYKGLVYHKNIIIDYIKQNYTIKNIFDMEENNDNKKNIISFFSTYCKDIEENYSSKQNTFHNDEFSVFVKVIENKNGDLKDSFIYINKIKYRTYNITNNIVGTIEQYDDNKLKIRWNIDDNTETVAQYQFNYNIKSYYRI